MRKVSSLLGGGPRASETKHDAHSLENSAILVASGKSTSFDDRPVDFAMSFDRLHVADEKDEKKRQDLQELQSTRQDILKAMRRSGLSLTLRPSSSNDNKGRPEATIVMVSIGEDMCAAEAERTGMDKLLRAHYTDPESDFPGYHPFKMGESSDVLKEDKHGKRRKHFLPAVDPALAKFEPGHDSYFTSLERQRCIYTKLEAPLTVGGAQLDLDGLKAEGVITDWTFLPDPTVEADLMETWVKSYTKATPVHKVRDYLGEKVGFYFAFLDHYIAALRPLSMFSVIVFGYQMYDTVQNLINGRPYWETDNILVPFYCIFMSIWSTIMLEQWKRRQAVLAYQWNVEDYTEDEPARPEYLRHELTKPMVGVFKQGVGFIPLLEQGLHGVQRVATRSLVRKKKGTNANVFGTALDDDELDDNATLVFPPAIHIQRVLISLAITLSLIACVAAGALVILAYKVVLRESDPVWGNYAGSFANVAFISITDQIWTRLALLLNDWEMHRTDSLWTDALIYKTFSFRFINKNATPFYIAFVQGLELRLFFNKADECPNSDCLRALSDYLLIAVVFSEASRNLLTLVPIATDLIKAKRAEGKGPIGTVADTKKGHKLMDAQEIDSGDIAAPKEALMRVEEELLKTKYPGTFDEMLEMSIQFGYVTMFAVGFPIAPFFCYINNSIERKTDAIKPLQMRRPRYAGSTGIGSWLYVLEFLTIFSVVTNMLIMFFSSKVLRETLGARLDLTRVLLVTVIVEHLLFVLKLGIAISVPDTPKWVERARTRLTLRERGTTAKGEREEMKKIRDQLRKEANIHEDNDLRV